MKQKSLFYGAALGVTLLVAATTSCVDSKFLDETQTTDLTKEVIFSDSAYTAGFLNNIYSEIGFDIYPNRFGQGGLQTACDEAEFKLNSGNNDGVQFVTGTVNPVSISDQVWYVCYRKIRAVNVFLANVDGCMMNEMAKNRYKAEARFLRAWYYHILLRHYGGVPLLGDVVYTNDDVDNVNMKRNTFAEVVDYIINECNAVASELPDRRSGANFGRASAGACMGLISRVRLYCASPLYNGTTLTTDPELAPLVGYTAADPERWKEAVDAARRLIATGSWQIYNRHMDRDGRDEPGWGFYAKFEAYDFTAQDTYKEYKYTGGAYAPHILSWRRGNMGQDRERLFYPASVGGSGDGGYPTLELVESFPMKDGAKPGEGKYTYDRLDPARNRDPRFANSVIWNNSKCQSGSNKDNVVYTFQGVGSTSDAIGQSTRTGFFWKKMCHRDCTPNYFVGVDQCYCLIQYSEILLNYAEAVNEYYGPDYTEQLGDVTVSPYYVLKMIRDGAGIEPGANGMYGLKDGMTKDEMREAIRLERRVELAYEGHRFFDVRRWKIAEETENATTHGLEITRKLNGSVSTRVIATRQHVFRPAMYFWPIPYNEVVRSKELLQNPYYE